MASVAESVYGQLSLAQLESCTIRPQSVDTTTGAISWCIQRRYRRKSLVAGVPDDVREYTRPIDADVLPTILGLLTSRVLAVDAPDMDVSLAP